MLEGIRRQKRQIIIKHYIKNTIICGFKNILQTKWNEHLHTLNDTKYLAPISPFPVGSLPWGLLHYGTENIGGGGVQKNDLK